MVTRTQAIKAFLKSCDSPKDLCKLYNEEMECQVSVAKGKNNSVKGKEYRGRKYMAYQDIEDGTVYKPFRIPYNAMSENCHYDDPVMSFDLKKYADGIGLTGWNWKQKKSFWVGYDFDSIINHVKGLTEKELKKIKDSVIDLDYVTVRSSTTGSGFHIYVFVDGVDSKTHTEHQSLARSILNKMSLDCGHELQSKVDQLGAILWFWASKKTKDGLTLIKQGNVLKDIPLNWKDHVGIINGKITKIRPDLIKDEELDDFNDLAKKRMRTPLDDKHRKIIEELCKVESCETSWNPDYGMLITHTNALLEVHKKLSLIGPYSTTSTGSSVKNCFAFPLEEGSWVVRRHGRGVIEAGTWLQDTNGWTKCYYNRRPDFNTACKTNKGVEDVDQSFAFRDSETAMKAAKDMGVKINLDPSMAHRQVKLKVHSKTDKLIVEVNAETQDATIPGWIKKPKIHQFVSQETVGKDTEKTIESSEEEIRHCISEEDKDAGWYIKGVNGSWVQEPRTNVLSVLSSMGYTFKEREMEIGRLTVNYWVLSNEPFGEEYPGNRRWNKDSAQLRFSIKEDTSNLSYPHWSLILDHVGRGLDEAVKKNNWCMSNGIETGSAYLKCWMASLIKFPKEPLPYLFFYGKENSGKTSYHEAIELLLTKGVKRVHTALESSNNFNGEVQGVILGIIEELNLSSKKGGATVNRIKDWVTSKKISIHEKGQTPYMTTNFLHFIQCSNQPDAAPVFPGDTRVVVCPVFPLDSEIPRNKLFGALESEGSDFTTELMNLEIPETDGRMRIPVVCTNEKENLADSNRDDIDRFISSSVYNCAGSVVSVADMWSAYCDFTDPGSLTMYVFNRNFQVYNGTVRGKYGPENGRYWANVSLDPSTEPSTPFVKIGETLKRKEI